MGKGIIHIDAMTNRDFDCSASRSFPPHFIWRALCFEPKGEKSNMVNR